MGAREEKIEIIRARVAEALTKLEGSFVAGTVLTFIARQPDDPDGRYDFMVTAESDKDADALIAFIHRRMKGGA